MNPNPKKEKRTLEGMIRPEVSQGVKPNAKTQTSPREALPAKAAEAATNLVGPGVAWTPA
jgi:hypothetical protein